ncbi:MAG: AAA family ATPase [Hyphomicrobiaceae bacterium]
MARNDLILTLVRAGVAGDKALLRSTVDMLAAEERAKKNTTLADRLTRAAQSNGNGNGQNGVTSLHGGSGVMKPGQEFVVESHPQRPSSELTLPTVVRREIGNLLEEHFRADLLRSHGIQPRHRVLLCGPPGNGKTALAESIAEGLGLPLLTVHYEHLIGSFLGETTQRLGRLFDHVRSIPCVLFFDEFDVVGKERGDAHETGEIKRVVSSLLLQIDALQSHVIVVTATNHAELLDRAVWRRFQVRLTLPAPSKSDLARFLAKAFKAMADTGAVDADTVAEALGPVSYAETTEFLLDLRRRQVLSLGEKRFAEVLSEQLPLWSARWKVHGHGERSDEAAAQVRPRRTGNSNKGRKGSDTLSAKPQTRAAKKGVRAEVHSAAKGARSRTKSARTQS